MLRKPHSISGIKILTKLVFQKSHSIGVPNSLTLSVFQIVSLDQCSKDLLYITAVEKFPLHQCYKRFHSISVPKCVTPPMLQKCQLLQRPKHKCYKGLSLLNGSTDKLPGPSLPTEIKVRVSGRLEIHFLALFPASDSGNKKLTWQPKLFPCYS